MASQEKSRETGKSAGGRNTGRPEETGGRAGDSAAQPDWSHGLRQLYDSVVDEDLPDSFKALLDKLDETDPEKVGHDDRENGGARSDQPPSRGSGA